MKVYFEVLVNDNQNNRVKLLLLAKFAYDNIKSSNTGYILFEFNSGFHPYVYYKKKANSRFKSKSSDALAIKLKNQMIICKNKFQYT